MALPVSFRWPEDFIARVDAVRGDVPRSRFIRRIVEDAISESNLAAAIVEVDEVVIEPEPEPEPEPEKVVASAEVPEKPFRCRHCDFSAWSVTARCPRHAGALVPA